MNIHFSAPSKTFLVGEYAVLNCGPALVMCTGPRFTFTAETGTGKISGVPEAAPAGVLLAQHKTLLSEWDLSFEDPHAGSGGFGASGAQFLFAHTLVTLLSASVKRATEGIDLQAVLNEYRTTCGGSGSGTDIVAQATGQVARIVNGAGDALSWPYPELDFAIVRTGQKIATHKHLENLNLETLNTLSEPAVHAVESFGTRSGADFVSEVRKFAVQLRALDLQVSRPRLEELEGEPWCLAAKGCGALGADTILLLFAAADLQLVKDYLVRENLSCIATSHDLSTGLEMKWSHS